MSNPKEKASELFTRFRLILPQESLYTTSKQCTMLCVSEIEKALEEYDNRNDTFELQNMDSSFRYWENVKKEIELL